jgi:hypothetical protein
LRLPSHEAAYFISGNEMASEAGNQLIMQLQRMRLFELKHAAIGKYI